MHQFLKFILGNKTPHVSDSSSVHHQQFFNVHTAMIYVIYHFSNLFLEYKSTYFGQFLCPSSGVFHCTHSNGICHTPFCQIYFWNKTLNVSGSSSVDHQEFFNVHTVMVYVIQGLLTACEQDQDALLSFYIFFSREILTIYKFVVPCIVILG